MGLFKKSEKKNIENWKEACYAEPDLKENLSLFSITNGQKTVLPKRDSYYSYSAEMPEDVKAEIDGAFEKAVRVFKINHPEDGEAIATQLLEIVDNILETGEFPEEYGDIIDVAVALGVLFGQALCCGYGWTWKVFGSSQDDTVFGVVSPEENFCNAPMLYLNRILSGQNTGLDGRNDNTVLLLYNMLKDIDQRPQDVKYYPVA